MPSAGANNFSAVLALLSLSLRSILLFKEEIRGILALVGK